MHRLLPKLAAVAALAAGVAGLTTAADDAKTDWSAYAKGPVITGEVTKVEKNGFTIKVPRPQPGSRTPKWDELPMEFAEGGLLRWDRLPPKIDENGKKKPYTAKETQERKTPKGVPGYSAEMDELQVGHIVKVELVRPKEIPANKAIIQDYKVKYATIIGQNPGPTK